MEQMVYAEFLGDLIAAKSITRNYTVTKAQPRNSFRNITICGYTGTVNRQAQPFKLTLNRSRISVSNKIKIFPYLNGKDNRIWQSFLDIWHKPKLYVSFKMYTVTWTKVWHELKWDMFHIQKKALIRKLYTHCKIKLNFIQILNYYLHTQCHVQRKNQSWKHWN